MASNPFATHHAAAGAAFKAGDHSKAMHHIGHMMLATRSAMKGSVAGQAAGATTDTMPPTADESVMDGDEGVSTPAPVPAKQHYFGQYGPKATPKAAPHVAPKASPMTATNHTASGGFNKSRFAAMGKK